MHLQGAKIDPIKFWTKPVLSVEMKQFFGLCNNYHKFVKNYACTAALLMQLLHTADHCFEFINAVHAGFVAVKVALSSARVMWVFDLDLKSQVLSDSLDMVCGSILE